MSTKTFALLYPERRSVSADTIERWYFDAVANGELIYEHDSTEDMADALADVGFITLAEDQE